VTALTFTHGELDKTNAQIYDDHWQGVLQFERVEAKRVENGVSGCTARHSDKHQHSL
jgi:predicted metal-dependent TIM-barrel fold hydrolase